jgi:streptogramin lyase
MTNDIVQRVHLRAGGTLSRSAWRKQRAGVWRRRRLVFDFLESRRLLSTNVAEFPIRVEGGNPEGIASGAGSDKNVWFTLNSNNIGMINPNNLAAGITQYPIPTYNSGDGPIAAGPDGNYWFFEETADRFGFINPTTGLITEIPLLSISNPDVAGITAGPNGYVWFTAYNTSQIGEINTANDQVTLFPTITPGAEPYGIVEGPDGNMWFTEAGTNQIGMINPTTHAMREFPIDSSGNDEAEGITVGPGSNLWLTLAGTNKIAVISPSDGALLDEYPVTANAAPDSITVGPNGNLWFTEPGLEDVATMTPAGNLTEIHTYSGGQFPFGITSGSDGNLWFVQTGDDQIDSISPSSDAISGYSYTLTSAAYASGIVSDNNGNLWFTQEEGNQVGELNPTTGSTTEFATPTSNSGAWGIALGANGNIYYAEFGHPNIGYVGEWIGVVDTSNGQIKDYATPSAGSFPYEIVDDPFGGDLWFTETAVDKIGRFDPQTDAMSEYSIPTANADPQAIAVDPSGNVWFTEYNSAQIGYLSPNEPNEIQSYPVAYTPDGIVADSSGNIWVSENNNYNFTLDEYNPSNGALINQYSVPSGHQAGALTIGPDGNIWFADSSGNIGTLTSSGAFQFYPTTGAAPLAITSPADGNIWFTGTGTSGDPNVIGVVTLSSTSAPTQLAVTTQPPGAVTATDGFGLVVAVENSAGNPDIDYTGTVTIALGNNPGGDTLKGTLTATVNQGIAVFSGLTLKVPDSGYTITATASGLSSTTSDAFNVTLGATRLVVTTEPPNSVQAGTDFSITVSAQDGEGNVDTSYNSAITLTLSNANGATLSGVLVVGANDGVAIFTGLSINQPGNDYVILASSGNLTSATSNGFDVTTGPAYQLVVATGGEPPSSVIAGAPFALTIEAEDQFGDEATSFDGSVTLSIANNSNGQLEGNLTQSASGGLVTFSGLSIDTVGNYTIEATSTGLIAATTSAVNVTAGQAVKLVVTAGNEPPSTITAGSSFGFVVDAVDNFGNIDPTYGSTVNIAASPVVTLRGSTTATAQNGVATFTGLSIDAVGTYTIQASSGSLTAGATTSVTVKPGSVYQLTVTAQPPSPITAAGTFDLAIGATDRYGNAVSTFSGTVIITLANNPGVTLYGTLSEPAQSGVATFSGLSITKAGNYQIQATSPGVLPATTITFTVSAAGANQLAFGQQPANTIAGTAIGPVTVEVEDASGNVVTTDDSTVTVTLSTGTFADGSNTQTAMASNGIATFSNLIVEAAGAYTLGATDGSLSPAKSSSFTIDPAPASYFVVTSSLSSPDVAGTVGTVTVAAYDTYNNLVSSGPDQYRGTVDLGSTDSMVSGLPPNYMFVAGDAGSHTFDNVDLKTAGSQTITATDSVSHDITGSVTVSVVFGTASQLSISVSPSSNVVAGNPLADPIVIDEEDQYGNIVNTDNTTQVTASLHSGAGTLTGTKTATVVNGVASFDDLEDDTAGTLSLQFTSPGLNTVISSPTTVSPGPATGIKVVGKPPNGVIAGISFGGFAVDVMDNYGNVETSFNGSVTAALASGSSGTLGGTLTVDAVSGEATFDDLVADTSGSISLVATTGATGTSLTSPSTDPVVVSPAPADHFIVTTTFANPDVAGSVGTVTVTAEDHFGNIANSGQNQYLGLVDLSTANIQATGLPSNYAFTAGDNGSHTFQNVGLETAGSQTITATDSSDKATTGTSAAVNVVPAAVEGFLVSTSFSNQDVAGSVGTVTVTAKDSYGNTVGSGPNQYLGTAVLGSTDAQAAGLGVSHTFRPSDAGSYTFTGVALKTAGAQTITATDSVSSSIVGSGVVPVIATGATGLMFSTPPPTPVIAGQNFTIVVSAEDPYHNIAASFDGNVTISLPGDSALTTTVQARNGVATFGGLSITTVGAIGTIEATSGGLSAGTTSPITVASPPPGSSGSPAPTIESDQIATTQKLKAGKKVGKPVFGGFRFQFNMPIDISHATFDVYSTVTKRIKKKTVTNQKAVSFAPSYDSSTNALTLTVKSTKPFAEAGGEVTISGVTSEAGTDQSPGELEFIVTRNAKGITET